MIKRIEKVFGLFILSLAIVYATVYLFFASMGKSILTFELENLIGKNVKIGYFAISPTFTIKVKNLNIDGFAKVDSISASPSFLSLLRGKVVLNNLILIQPELIFNKVPPEVANISASTDTVLITKPNQVKSDKTKPFPFGLIRLNIENGRIVFIDQSVGPGSLRIAIKDINCNISNIYLFPRSTVTNFSFKGNIPWKEGQLDGKIELVGWLNPTKKDIQADLKITNIDAVYLYPYYSYWVDLDKARIEKAKLNLTSKIYGKNNNVTIDCHMELIDMVRKPLEQGQSEDKEGKVTSVVLDMFKSLDQGKVELNFSIKTKLDSPQFNFANIKMAFEDKITKSRNKSAFKFKDFLIFPAKFVEGSIKSVADLSKASIDGALAIFGDAG